MKPDTTAIRAFAAGMRTSVGIRDELLAARSHLLALCDALDAERGGAAPTPPPRRWPEAEPLSPEDESDTRELWRESPPTAIVNRLLATLDAERAANAEMRRALALADHLSEAIDTHLSAAGRVVLADERMAYVRARNALRAADGGEKT